MTLGLQNTPHCEGIQDRRALHRRPARNRVRTSRIGPPCASGGLRDVEGNRCRCTVELIEDRSVAPLGGTRDFNDQGEKLQGGAVDVELLEGQHGRCIGGSWAALRVDHVAVAVAVHVDDHVDDHDHVDDYDHVGGVPRLARLPAMPTEDLSVDHVLILCTAPNEEVGATLARGLVEARLAACVNLVPGIRSFYRWEGAVQDEAEVQLLIKTRSGRFAAVAGWIKANHPYTVPEVIALPIPVGADTYLAWLTAETGDAT